MQANSLNQKILLIIIGLIAAVLFGEVLFRIGGFIVNETRGKAFDSADSYRILCIGDSTTYGLGASNIDKFGYPNQLRKILEDNVPDKDFEIVNLGKPGMNSSQVANRFMKNLSEYEPDVVIVMVGINDPWNLEESNIMKHYNIAKDDFYITLGIRLELLLNKSKLYQFFKLILLSDKFIDLKIPNFDDKARSKGFVFSKSNRIKSEALFNTIAGNIVEMKQIAEDSSVNLLFMKYHNIGWGSPELIINDVYSQLGVSVVDNETLFMKAKQYGLKILGNDNWHPGDLGYELMAKNIYNKLVLSGLVNGNPVSIFD